MNTVWPILVAAALAAAPMAYAHNLLGTPDTTCEDTAQEWSDHDYGPPATGVLLSGLQDSNLEDCDGDFDPTDPLCWAEEAAREDLDGDTDVCEAFDYDGHGEYSRGGAWLLVVSDNGAGGGSVACFGEAGHHPAFGPIYVDDALLGTTAEFRVAADTLDGTGLGDACGDFQSDVGADCIGSCTVTFPAGLDGSYQVYVVGTQGHVGSHPPERCLDPDCLETLPACFEPIGPFAVGTDDAGVAVTEPTHGCVEAEPSEGKAHVQTHTTKEVHVLCIYHSTTTSWSSATVENGQVTVDPDTYLNGSVLDRTYNLYTYPVTIPPGSPGAQTGEKEACDRLVP